jgi:hypothetical protein
MIAVQKHPDLFIPDVLPRHLYLFSLQDEYDQGVHMFLLCGGSLPPTMSDSMAVSISDSGMFTSWLRPALDTSLCSSVGETVGGGSGVGVACSTDAVASSVSDDSVPSPCSEAIFCSNDQWMAQWQMFAMHRPVLVQVTD